jgi:hypothetical protein
MWGPVLIENIPLDHPQRLVDLRPDGTVQVDNGIRFRLAGLRLRTVEETQEPEALDLVQRITGGQIELHHEGDSESAVAYYRQARWYRCGTAFLLPHPLTLVHFLPKYERASLNELLVRVGLAEFDPGIGTMSQPSVTACRQAAEAYRAALACEAERRQAEQKYGDVIRPAAKYQALDYFVGRPWMLAGRFTRLTLGDLQRLEPRLIELEPAAPIACAPAWNPIFVANQPLNDPKPLRGLTADGHLILKNGARFRLAGIRLRPFDEVAEPNALEQVNSIIGNHVELQRAGDAVLACYRQECWPWPELPSDSADGRTPRSTPKYKRALVNELLIRIGLAEYDPQVGVVPPRATEQLLAAQGRYAEALARESRRRRAAREYPAHAVESFGHEPLSYYATWPYMLSDLTAIRLSLGDLRRLER